MTATAAAFLACGEPGSPARRPSGCSASCAGGESMSAACVLSCNAAPSEYRSHHPAMWVVVLVLGLAHPGRLGRGQDLLASLAATEADHDGLDGVAQLGREAALHRPRQE